MSDLLRNATALIALLALGACQYLMLRGRRFRRQQEALRGAAGPAATGEPARKGFLVRTWRAYVAVVENSWFRGFLGALNGMWLAVVLAALWIAWPVVAIGTGVVGFALAILLEWNLGYTIGLLIGAAAALVGVAAFMS